jgi:hypothetical protein
MGQAKKDMMRRDDMENIAMGVLVKAGAVKECDLHEGIYLDNEDPDAVNKAYAIGTNLWKSGEIDGDREEFMESIKNAYETNAGWECGMCARHRDD